MILPDRVLGSPATNSIARGATAAASLLRAKSHELAPQLAGGLVASFNDTNALTTSILPRYDVDTG